MTSPATDVQPPPTALPTPAMAAPSPLSTLCAPEPTIVPPPSQATNIPPLATIVAATNEHTPADDPGTCALTQSSAPTLVTATGTTLSSEVVPEVASVFANSAYCTKTPASKAGISCAPPTVELVTNTAHTSMQQVAETALLSPPTHVTVPFQENPLEVTPMTRLLLSDWFREFESGVGPPGAIAVENPVFTTPNPPLPSTNDPLSTGNPPILATTRVKPSPRRSPRGHSTNVATVQKVRKEDVVFARYMDARFPIRLSGNHARTGDEQQEEKADEVVNGGSVERAVHADASHIEDAIASVDSNTKVAKQPDQSCEWCKLMIRLGTRCKRPSRTSIRCFQCKCCLCSAHWDLWHSETITDWGERPRKWSSAVDKV